MSDSRSRILARLRSTRLPESALPDVFAGPGDEAAIVYNDLRGQFAESVRQVGGQCHVAPSYRDAARLLRDLPAMRQAPNGGAVSVCNLVPELPLFDSDIAADGASAAPMPSRVAVRREDDPHGLESLDWAVIPGEFGVAENGAVWVAGERLPQRVLLFLVQHLALIVPARELVHHLHQAYSRLSFLDAGFGVFVSGPSKTADIEQSLVIGAHGARSLTVVLCEER